MNNFERCEGRPEGPCSFKRQDRSVKFSVSDLFLCPDCDDYRNPLRHAMSDNTVKTETVPVVTKHGIGSVTPSSVTNTTTKSLKDTVVISEVSCFVIASFHQSAHRQIKSSLLDVYSAEEICAAKLLIHKAASSLSDSVPRLIKRKNSDNRLKLEIEDLFHLLTTVDEQLLLKRLPTYVIADPFRVPSLDVEENDSRVLSLKVNKLEKKLDQLLIILQNNMVQVHSPMITQHTLPQNPSPVMPQSAFPQTESCVTTANILKAEDQTATLPGFSGLSAISEFNVDQTMGEICAVTHPDMPVMSDSNSDVIVESEPSIATVIHPSTLLYTTQLLESSVLTSLQTDTTESAVSMPSPSIPASEDAGNSTEIPWNDMVKRRSPMKL